MIKINKKCNQKNNGIIKGLKRIALEGERLAETSLGVATKEVEAWERKRQRERYEEW